MAQDALAAPTADRIFTEAVALATGVWVQAGPHGFRLHRAAPWGAPPCDEFLAPAGDFDTTRQLMAGAFYAGFPERRDDPSAAISLLTHIHVLAGCYQTTHATPPTMRRVAARLDACGHIAAAAHCLQVADEESGHDALALKDLASLGLPAKEFVARHRPQGSLALVDFFIGLANSARPVAVLGYAYALERMALFCNGASIEAVERLVPPGVKATRCMRVHSAEGSDPDHVAKSLALIATLPPEDRAAIARAAYGTSVLQWAAPRDYPGDAAMRAMLGEFECAREVCAPP